MCQVEAYPEVDFLMMENPNWQLQIKDKYQRVCTLDEIVSAAS